MEGGWDQLRWVWQRIWTAEPKTADLQEAQD
jgi:hypothetical protein